MFYKIKSTIILNLIACACFITHNTFAQSAHNLLREGDAAYVRKDYKKAEDNYRNAQTAERSYKGSFNLGNTLYMQQRYDDALQIFDGVANRATTNTMRGDAFYNKGNTHIFKNEYDKAIENYKEALRLNPNDLDAKKNLAFAKKQEEQKKKQEKDKQQQNQNQDKDKQQQNQNQNKDKQQQQQNQDKNNPQQPQNQQQNQDKNNPQQQKQQPEMNKDNAERLLQIMDNEDQKVQQRLKKGKPNKKPNSAKDW